MSDSTDDVDWYDSDCDCDSDTASTLSKRELFAAMAMQGYIRECVRWDNAFPQKHSQVAALWAVEYADALLAELAKERK